jgi:hypothetical protein
VLLSLVGHGRELSARLVDQVLHTAVAKECENGCPSGNESEQEADNLDGQVGTLAGGLAGNSRCIEGSLHRINTTCEMVQRAGLVRRLLLWFGGLGGSRSVIARWRLPGEAQAERQEERHDGYEDDVP